MHASVSIVKVMVKTVQVQTNVVIFVGLTTLAIACAVNVVGFEYTLLIQSHSKFVSPNEVGDFGIHKAMALFCCKSILSLNYLTLLDVCLALIGLYEIGCYNGHDGMWSTMSPAMFTNKEAIEKKCNLVVNSVFFL